MTAKYEAHRRDVNFIKKFIAAQNTASGSEVDANSNVSGKNIATLAPEVHKRENIQINRLMMYDELCNTYGEETAEKYIEQLENHEIYTHDESTFPMAGVPYCASITLYPYLFDGMTKLSGTTLAPKNLDSFCGGFINLVFAVAAQLKGAVATPEFLAYMDYFLRKEYGDDYYTRPDEVVDLSSRHATIDTVITDHFQQVVYSINQPAAARGSQSVFWNAAYFDKYYFESLFENFVFPDGTEMQWESVSWLQKRFMKWFNNERLKEILTFPVETLSLLNNGEQFLDKEWADFAAEMYAEGHSFFTYTSDSVDSLASCCFSGDTKVLAKSSNGVFLNIPIEELHQMPWSKKKNLTVYHNGSWVTAKTIELSGRPMYRLSTANHKTVCVTDNHLWPTLNGLKQTKELTVNDWIMFNTKTLNAVPERDRKLSYLQGRLIGLYLGDGLIDANKTVNLNLSLINDIDMLNSALLDCGIEDKQFVSHESHDNVYPVSLYGTELHSFIEEYAEIDYDYSNEKHIRPEVFLQSEVFRKGILDGISATNGGNSNRIYTTSRLLAEDLEALCSTLGMNTIIDCTDDREKEPLWCVRWYDPKNERSMPGVYKIVNNSMYFKVTDVTALNEIPDKVYCFECANQDEPYFTLPNGMITHNCRLRNGITENQFSYTLGAGGISTGSKCVVTMNINRLVQNTIKNIPNDVKPLEAISAQMHWQTQLIHKYLTAYNNILLRMTAQHMISIYDAGFISPEKEYLTVGINGAVEGAEFLGIEISDNSAYKEYIDAILRPIYELNKQDRTKDTMFNTEFVPKLVGTLNPF